MKGLDRFTRALPEPWSTIADWAVTITVAIAVVLVIKAWIVNPYRIPSSSMEPTLHCAQPESGCQAGASDRVLANRFIYHFRDPQRGQIVVFETPPEAVQLCGAGGTYVKRLVAVPGDSIGQVGGIVRLNGTPITESYVEGSGPGPDFPERRLEEGEYFMMGDNRAQSCDSRDWGPVSRGDLIGPVFAVYWPPTRLGPR